MAAPPPPPKNIPGWLQRVIKENDGFSLLFLFEKSLTESDVDRNQNALTIPTDLFLRRVVSLLCMERRALGLGRYRDASSSAVAAAPAGREQSVDVTVFNEGRCKFSLKLMRVVVGGIGIGGGEEFVLQGEEWRKIVKLSGFQPNKRVQLWSFRTKPSFSLNFAVGEVDD